MTRRTNARIAGFTFLFYIAAGLRSMALAGRTQQTKLDVVLDAPDSGAFLARYGYAEGVKGAATRIEGQLGWTGAPHEFGMLVFGSRPS